MQGVIIPHRYFGGIFVAIANKNSDKIGMGAFACLGAVCKEVRRPFAWRVLQGKFCGRDFFEAGINPPLFTP